MRPELYLSESSHLSRHVYIACNRMPHGTCGCMKATINHDSKCKCLQVPHAYAMLAGGKSALFIVQADSVFLSPPWGGPAYSQPANFDVSKEIGSLQQNMVQLLQTASSCLKNASSQSVACFLPRNTDLHVLSSLLQSQQQCCVERDVLNSHLKAVTVYFGSLAAGEVL